MTEAEAMREFADLVWALAWRRGWFLPGAEIEDLAQEGFIGLLLAVRTYRASEGRFPAFARLCIEGRMITAIKAATTQKQEPLSSAGRWVVNELGELEAASEWIPDPRADVERQAAGREALRSILRAAEGMTDIERRAIFGVAYGAAYVEIDGPGGVKRVDNAQGRALEKLRAAA